MEIKGLNLARIGDKIEVDAWYPKGGEAAQRAIANRLTISAAQPLTGKKPSKRNSKRGTKKGATEKKGSEKKKADPFGDDDK